MSYSLNPEISGLVARSVLITGVARSGTTLMGTLMYSLENVEYIFEPPLLTSLVPAIDEVSTKTWRLLFETYLFEDFLIGAVAGRRINTNRHDDSCIYNAKSEEEVQDRLSHSMGKDEAFRTALTKRIALKLPSVLPRVTKLRSLYPEMQVLIMLRRPEAVLSSMLRKNWLSDRRLRAGTVFWPSREGYELCVPYWVPEASISGWLEASEIDRCCMFYAAMYESISGSSEGSIIADYDRFLLDPTRCFQAIAERLNLNFGARTLTILDGVGLQESSSALDMKLVNSEMRTKLTGVYESLRAKSIA